MDGGVDFSLEPHPQGLAKVPCRPAQQRKSEGQCAPGSLAAPLLMAWKAGVSLSERQGQQQTRSWAGSVHSCALLTSFAGNRTSLWRSHVQESC